MTLPAPRYVANYDPDADFDRWYTRATADAILPWLRPGERVLELGCATGLMTSMLVAAGVRIWAVDRYAEYLAVARARGLAGVTFVEGDVEDDVDCGGPVDHVVATGLLHELPEPARFLRRCADRLPAGSLLHLCLPNPMSLHRLVAYEMGLIDDLTRLSANSEVLGHHGHLTGDEVLAMAAGAGFRCEGREGIMLKPLTNAQLSTLPEDVLTGLVRAARHLPEHGAMTHLTLRRA